MRVPRIDRAATDLHRLPCIVVARHGNKQFQYRLQCKYGVLDTSYRESELEAYAGDQQFGNIQDWEEAPVVSLREAAKSANPSNAYYGAACHCRKGCSGNQCSCRKAGKPCSTRCHSGRSCVNCRDSNPEREPMRMKISSTDSGSEISAPNLQPKRTKISSTDSDSEIGISPEPSPAKQSPISIRSSSFSPPPPSDWWVKDLLLKPEDKKTLLSGGWLSDHHIGAAQKLLKNQYPHIDGLQSPVLGSRLMFSVMASEGIQIINHQKHWICVSTIGCQPGHVDIYDSLYSTLSPSAIQQICNLLHTKEVKLTVRMRDMQMQHGTSDCGLFSIACAVCLCQGEDPCRFSWTQELMRQHLTNCLSTQRMSSFPGNSRKVSAKIKRTIHIPVFCSCRMPENKMGMAQCTRCEEWFHKKCQNIPRAVFLKSIATWFCKECV